jgi:dolichol-phosphate mannosyltransferase
MAVLADSGRRREKLGLVIPTLCEAQNLQPLLERVRFALDPLAIKSEILVVDDDSRDCTAEVINAMTRSDPRVRLLIRQGQKGLSGAVLHGWAHTDASILGVMDADLQHPPELLPQLVDAISSGCDLAIGSRYASGGELGSWNPLRRLFSSAAVLATWPIQRRGLRAHDPMSGFFLVRRDCLAGIPFQQSGFKLLLEILVRARISSVREIPFAFGRRYRGSSKAGAKIAIEYGKLLVRLYRGKLASPRTIPASLAESGD